MKKPDKTAYFLRANFGRRLRDFAEDFEALTARYFSQDLKGLPEFVDNYSENPVQPSFTWGKLPPAFYRAELATIAVLNKAMWDGFCRANDIVLFVPDCLSLLGSKCKRAGDEFLEKCSQCVPNCSVNKIASLKERFEFVEVFAYRDQTEQFKKLREKYPSVAFLGLACILMLADGMRTSMTNGIPAYGIPLTFCGCEHWLEKPVPTDIDLDEVRFVLSQRAAARQNMS